MSVTAPTSRKDDLAAVAKPLAAAITAGFVAGLTIGGVGGRLAMFVLRLTSDPAVRGLETDETASRVAALLDEAAAIHSAP